MVFISLVFFTTTCLAQQKSTEKFHQLQIEKSEKRRISGGEVHKYSLNLKAAALLRVNIEQDSSWLTLYVYGPDSALIQEFVWAPKSWPVTTYTSSPPYTFLAEPRINYTIELHSSVDSGQSSNYFLRIEKLPDGESEKNQAAIQWFSRNAIPIRSLTAGKDFSDLMPLKRILRDVRVVGLGEATHGSREFFQFKHRMLEFLVIEMGFTVFGIESSYAACEKINEYVLYGRGNRDEVLAGQGFWQWDTEEIAEMIEWMRQYNKLVSQGKKVKFYGFDFQANDLAIETVLTYLKKVAPERVDSAASALRPLQMDNPKRPTFLPLYSLGTNEKTLIAARVGKVFDFLSLNNNNLIQQSSLKEYEKALQHAKLLHQFTHTYSNPTYEEDRPESGVATRERYMSENIEGILKAEGENSRMVVWSHNGHIKTTPYVMGHYLRKAFGNSYYAFGFSFNRGSFQALGIRGKDTPVVEEFAVRPAYQGSVGWLLKRVEKENFAVNLRDAPTTGLVAEWLALPHPMRSIGNGFSPQNPSGYYRPPIALSRSFDGIIFIENTTRARPKLKR